jgi:hypothetical protein
LNTNAAPALSPYSNSYQTGFPYQGGNEYRNTDGIESITRNLGLANLGPQNYVPTGSNHGMPGIGVTVEAQSGYITNEKAWREDLITKKECK